MKSLVMSLAVLGLAALAGVAQAGPGCSGSEHPDRTAESPAPPPPPAPTT